MSKTPKTIKKADKISSIEKIMDSGKKLVQARLPFKIIPTSSAVREDTDKSPQASSTLTAEGHKQAACQEVRKRKLSYEIEEVKPAEGSNLTAGSKENLVVTTKKKKIDDDEEDVIHSVDTESEDENDTQIKQNKLLGNNHKITGTPHSKSQLDGKSRYTAVVQIKLPLSSGKKNKRKKSGHMPIKKLEAEASESSDDIEVLAEQLNPQKRLRVSESVEIEKGKKKSHPQEKNPQVTEATESDNEDNTAAVNNLKSSSNVKNEPNDKGKEETETDEVESYENEVVTDSADPTNDIALHEAKKSEDQRGTIDNKTLNSPKVNIDLLANDCTSKKNLTPKQLKLIEQRHKAREEKERKLQEEKLQKQREKEEKELSRKREREEKDEQRRKEREEKDEQKRRERDEKERKRLAEIELKNEEKRKRNEAREEEIRKKEDDRKRREQEKEDAEMKKKKAAEAFTKFFVAKPTRSAAGSENADKSMLSAINGRIETLAFRPFQRKGDMELAPVCRVVLSKEAQQKLDTFLPFSVKRNNIGEDDSQEFARVKPVSRDQLYLSELKSGKITPGKWPSKPVKDDNDDDILIVEDDLERVGQEIFEGTRATVERHRAKFYKFYENRRPPYFGTWRKKTNLITARRPFSQDKKYFDYELDSDLEWEEEEPGESLDGSDDDKEKESEDDEYEVDNEWFVPHGHLSDEEIQNEDEFGVGDDNTREAQKAKLKILQQEFAQEMKKKTEKIKPRLLGSIWVDENGKQPQLCPKIIWDSLNQRTMLCTIPPLVEEPEVPDKNEPGSPSSAIGMNAGTEKTTDKLKPIVLTEQMLKDLICLVHGNRHAKAFLIKEFIAYIEANADAIKSGDVRGPLKSVVRERIDEFAEWQITEAKTSSNKKQKRKKRLCWVVSKDVLKRMDLEHLGMDNAWQYTLQPKFINSQNEFNTENACEGAGELEENQCANETGVNVEEQSTAVDITQTVQITSSGNAVKCNRNPEITKFTKLQTSDKKSLELKQKKPRRSGDLVNKAKTCATPVATTPTVTNTKIVITSDSNVSSKTGATPPSKPQKRVQLLKTVPQSQQIKTEKIQPIKNALISKYLKSSNRSSTNNSTTVPDQVDDDDDVIMID